MAISLVKLKAVHYLLSKRSEKILLGVLGVLRKDITKGIVLVRPSQIILIVIEDFQMRHKVKGHKTGDHKVKNSKTGGHKAKGRMSLGHKQII